MLAGLVDTTITAASEERTEGPLEGPVTVDFAGAVAGAFVTFERPDGERYEFALPPGIEDDERLRVPVDGLEVVLVVQMLPHPCFRRTDLDLHVKLPATLDELRTGARLQLRPPTGSPPSSCRSSRSPARSTGCAAAGCGAAMRPAISTCA